MDNYFSRKVGKNAKLIKVLSELYPELSYNFLMKLVRKKDVFINGKRASADSNVCSGDTVSLFLCPSATPFNVCFESEYVFCVNKQKGIQSDGTYSLSGLAKYVFPDCVMLHRLDTNTSGLVLFAKCEQVAEYVKEQMKNGHVEKTYLATVYGEPDFRNTTLTGYLQKDAESGRVKIFDSPGKNRTKVSLACSVVSRKDGLSVLEVKIHNGKTHQIRSQLAYSGYFIIGDGKYGDDRINRMYGYKSQELKAVRIKFDETCTEYGLRDLVIELK